MPYLKIQVNRELVPEKCKQLLTLVSQRTAKELSKPEAYVMVEIGSNAAMIFAGTDGPAAYVELKSIGLPPVLVRPLSKMLCGLLEEQLDIPPARIYIEFTDAKGSYWGWNGGTF